MEDNYDYSDAGFDGFLSRSVDNIAQVNLDSTGPQSTQMRYDSAQVSGQLGDKLTVGSITIDGVSGNITVADGETVRVLIGYQQDGF